MENESAFKWTHLGDGVYALYDGYHVVLRTDQARIYLDPHVLAALNAFASRHTDGDVAERASSTGVREEDDDGTSTRNGD